MTDLHTHILPGMDDGAQSVSEALEMLRIQVQQNVDTVALTPHYYGDKETIAAFVARRESAFKKLKKAIGDEKCPRMVLGAEVEWTPELLEWPDLEALCYENTNILLLELPVIPWSEILFHQLYALEARRGIMPMIAHIDRYFGCQKSRYIWELASLGYPIQVSAEALVRLSNRKRALALLEMAEGLLISDCHNLKERAPNLNAAMRIVEKKLGWRKAAGIAAITDEILD